MRVVYLWKELNCFGLKMHMHFQFMGFGGICIQPTPPKACVQILKIGLHTTIFDKDQKARKNFIVSNCGLQTTYVVRFGLKSNFARVGLAFGDKFQGLSISVKQLPICGCRIVHYYIALFVVGDISHIPRIITRIVPRHLFRQRHVV